MIARRLWTRLTCNPVTLAIWCSTRGHQWDEHRLCRCYKVTSCARCGHFLGWQGQPRGCHRRGPLGTWPAA